MPLLRIFGIPVLAAIILFAFLYSLTRLFVSRRSLAAILGGLLFVVPTLAWVDWVLLKYGPRSLQTILLPFLLFGLPTLLLGAIDALILRSALVDAARFLPSSGRRTVVLMGVSFLVVLMTICAVVFLGAALGSGDPAGFE